MLRFRLRMLIRMKWKKLSKKLMTKKKRDAPDAALVSPQARKLPEQLPHFLLTFLIPLLIAFALSTEPGFC